MQIVDVCIDFAKALFDLDSVIHSRAIFEGVASLVTNNARTLGVSVNIVSELHDGRIELTKRDIFSGVILGQFNIIKDSIDMLDVKWRNLMLKSMKMSQSRRTYDLGLPRFMVPWTTKCGQG